MVALKQEKFDLPRNLRGRGIHQNVIPTVANLKNMIDRLVSVNGDVSQLKSWELRCYSAYHIDKIKKDIIEASAKEDKASLIKKHILNGDPNDFGPSCIDIYLVAYVAENVKPGKQAFIEYVMKNGITEKLNSAQAIWQVGKGDGVYLGVLNNDGSISDWAFFSEWVNGLDGKQVTIHNKLVRDRVPELIMGQGKIARIRQLANSEYMMELRRKATEELNEYFNSNTNEEAVEELADLLEVIYSLADTHGYSVNDMEQIRKRKLANRGGFKERIYLIESEK